MKKKIFILLLCVVLVATCILCGVTGIFGNDSQNSAKSQTPDTAVTENVTFPSTVDSLTLKVGESKLIELSSEKAKSVTKWTSSDSKIVTVDDGGRVDALKEGTALISAISKDKSKSEVQVMVAKSDVADKIKSADDLKDKTVVAEKKSAGESVAQTDEFFSSAKYVSVDAQAKALLEVKSGTADVAVIDYVMSIGTLKSGSDYADLKVVDGKDFSPEQYGIALRKDSPETLKKLNDAIQAVADDGTLDKIAEKYSLQDLLLVKKK